MKHQKGRMRWAWRRIVRGVAIALLLCCPSALHAQAVKGELLGNVTDQSGLALPGVSVTITEQNTNISYTTTTNESG